MCNLHLSMRRSQIGQLLNIASTSILKLFSNSELWIQLWSINSTAFFPTITNTPCSTLVFRASASIIGPRSPTKSSIIAHGEWLPPLEVLNFIMEQISV